MERPAPTSFKPGKSDLPFKEGVVVTVEPGIYIPEEGIGIRIEDVILVTTDGPQAHSQEHQGN